MRSQLQNLSAPKTKKHPFELTECLLSCLNDRERDILRRRYALDAAHKQTLESIGATYTITRERVRQIERASLQKIKRLLNYREVLQDVIDEIDRILGQYGGIIAHHHLVEELHKKSKDNEAYKHERNHLIFLIEQFMPEFFHFHEEGENHKLAWTKEKEKIQSVKNVLSRIEAFLQKHAKPVSESDIAQNIKEKEEVILAYLHLGKRLLKNPFGYWGLSHWPEVNPKRMADRIYAVLNKYKEPLHYRDIAQYIETHYQKKTHAPTVHNELIADSRFVLVGRGIYALRQWGYVPGTVKDIVEEVLHKSRHALGKEEIITEVQKQRLVSRSTILLAINKSKNIKKINKDTYIFTGKQPV